ncbi:ligA domain protein [Lysobacter antibioticus]|uniref:hypothetical protein n=1 Tax=Lysobacter antibioticus TaxID=84531 RepID=UPI0007174D32|nr:hypothetical protein [Lysobacter antibioticus]ALN61893.1 ligA domain protein [Lysobacter antibioticus]
MFRRLFLASLLLTASHSAASAAATPACPALSDVSTPPHCLATEHGWFYAGSESEAAAYAEYARIVSIEFARTFARPAPFGAVVAIDSNQLLPESTKAALKQQGAHWLLAWLDTEYMRKEVEKQVRKQFKQQNPGMAPAKLNALTRDFAQRSADRSDLLRHEIGHSVLKAAYWPQEALVTDDAHYGSSAPDWLDEAAAIAMEGPKDTESRRILFVQMAAGDLYNAPLKPLDQFLGMQHPRKSDAGLPAAMRSSKNNITVGIGNLDDNAALVRMIGYYAQVRGWVDFLSDSAKPGVLGSIAESLAGGNDFEQWLSQHAAEYGLATSLPALQSQWAAWVRKGQAPGKSAPKS